MEWFRWHHGTVLDPKWRIIAHKAGTSIANVVAVWASMLESASASEDRGTLSGWKFDEIAVALGLEEETVFDIWEAMQGKVIEASRLMAWERRQPKREDDSRERVQKHRALRNESNALKRTVTHGNAVKRSVTPDRRDREDREETALTTLCDPADAHAKKKQTFRKSPEMVYSDDFESLWSIYPKRAGTNPKKDAYRAFEKSRGRGATVDAIRDGLSRYIAQQTALGNIGTEYVMQAVRFFGPNDLWLDEYALPPETADDFPPDELDEYGYLTAECQAKKLAYMGHRA